MRSDNGSELTANTIRTWLKDLGVTTLYVEPGSRWENGYVESYIGKLRDFGYLVLPTFSFKTRGFSSIVPCQEAGRTVESWIQHNRNLKLTFVAERPPLPQVSFREYLMAAEASPGVLDKGCA
jgi:transposase InsO family protein